MRKLYLVTIFLVRRNIGFDKSALIGEMGGGGDSSPCCVKTAHQRYYLYYWSLGLRRRQCLHLHIYILIFSQIHLRVETSNTRNIRHVAAYGRGASEGWGAGGLKLENM